MTPQAALDEGYENHWLRDLAPDYKPKTSQCRRRTASAVRRSSQRIAAKLAEPPGKASARYDAENIGYGVQSRAALAW